MRKTSNSIAAVAFSFTAVAIAQLVERGRISFDDPLSRFLPSHFAPGVADRVQIRHLFSHTSGLGDYLPAYRDAPNRQRVHSIDDFLELVHGDSLAFEPGTRWSYSNTGFLVLGRVVEIASGLDYHRYVRENIYEPAGMQRTGELEVYRGTAELATGYDREHTVEDVQYRDRTSTTPVRGGPARHG